MPDIRVTMFLEPKDTVRVWQARGELRPTVRWSEMMHEEHAAAFTVAKVAKLDLLHDIRVSLDTVIRNGGTFEQWKADLLPSLQKHGWWGMVRDKSVTGTDNAVLVNDRRLRTIYRTNVRMSRSAGRWRRYQAQKDIFPYIRYRSDHPRKNPRQQHLAWHGLILPVDHVFWQTHWPPNGWGCNCKPEQMSERDMRREGLTVSDPPIEGPPQIFYPAGSDKPVQVPAGINPGFGYNPGTAHLQAIADKTIRSIEQAEMAGLNTPIEQLIAELINDPGLEQFVALPAAAYPLAWLSGKLRGFLGSNSSMVRFSKATADKQSGKRVLVAEDYRRLQSAIASPEMVFSEKGGKDLTIFTRDKGGKLWLYAIKRTGSGDENYMTSARRADDADIQRKLKSKSAKLLEDNR